MCIPITITYGKEPLTLVPFIAYLLPKGGACLYVIVCGCGIWVSAPFELIGGPGITCANREEKKQNSGPPGLAWRVHRALSQAPRRGHPLFGKISRSYRFPVPEAHGVSSPCPVRPAVESTEVGHAC